MKKIDLGQTMTIVANVGVIIGILLLAYELNQSRDMMQAQTRNAIADTLVEILYQRATSPYLAEVIAKLEAGEQLSDVELVRFGEMQGAEWRYRENVHYQYRNGLYEETEYLAQRDAWRRIVNAEAVRINWCNEARTVMATEFRNEIDGLLERPCE